MLSRSQNLLLSSLWLAKRLMKRPFQTFNWMSSKMTFPKLKYLQTCHQKSLHRNFQFTKKPLTYLLLEIVKPAHKTRQNRPYPQYLTKARQRKASSLRS